MAKLSALVLILGLCSNFNGVLSGSFLADLQELDELMLTATWDLNRPGHLPTTPEAIEESWCRPMLEKSMRAMDLIEGLFDDNPLLLIIYRVEEMTKINLATKFCDNPDMIRNVAHFNHQTNMLIPRLIPWYKLTVNTYLAAADPRSHLDAGDLICLCKKFAVNLLQLIPPKMRKGLVVHMAQLQSTQGKLAAIILHHVKVDLFDDECHLVHHQAPNPFGIRSQEVAGVLAWDRVLRQLSG